MSRKKLYFQDLMKENSMIDRRNSDSVIELEGI